MEWESIKCKVQNCIWANLKEKVGITPLQFTQFPYTTVATTFSATNGVTDSAAAGTALATGNKTKNGAIGVLKDLQTPVYSVATWAKERGCRVGVATSVSVDHADEYIQRMGDLSKGYL